MPDSTNKYTARLALLSFIGLGVSAWLLFHHVEVNGGFQRGESFCDVGTFISCTSVAESRFSEVFGVPVAAWGLLFYLVFLLMMLFKPRSAAAEPQARFAAFLVVLSVLALVPTLLLAGVSILLLSAVCLMCVCLYLINILLTVVAWRHPSLSGYGSTEYPATALAFLRSDLPAQVASIRGLLAMLLLLLVTPVVFYSPKLLTEYYFVPKEERLRAEETLRPIFEAWQGAAALEGLDGRDEGEGIGRSFSKGPATAPLVLLEFSDFQCPFCARAAREFDEVRRVLPDDVKIVFKHYPLDPSCNDRIPEGYGHRFACRAAAMAQCAGAQAEEKFWQMHDALFALDEWSEERLALLPEELSLDTAAFSDCLEDPATAQKIAEDLELGNRAGVEATPTMFLNGKPLNVLNIRALTPFLEFARERLE